MGTAVTPLQGQEEAGSPARAGQEGSGKERCPACQLTCGLAREEVTAEHRR